MTVVSMSLSRRLERMPEIQFGSTEIGWAATTMGGYDPWQNRVREGQNRLTSLGDGHDRLQVRPPKASVDPIDTPAALSVRTIAMSARPVATFSCHTGPCSGYVPGAVRTPSPNRTK